MTLFGDAVAATLAVVAFIFPHFGFLGFPVIEFSLRHSSIQAEAGHNRRVELDMPAIAFGTLAQRLAQDAPGRPIMARGFLARRSLRSTQVVLHARDIEYQ